MIGLVLVGGCLFVVVLVLALCRAAGLADRRLEENAAWEAEARRLLAPLYDDEDQR